MTKTVGANGHKEKLRMCIVCRGQSDKKELLRIVKNKNGEIFVDKTGKANGRGAYVCKDKECFSKLCKTNYTGCLGKQKCGFYEFFHVNIFCLFDFTIAIN